MRKLLLFFTLFLAAVVVKAAPVDWSDGNGNTVKYDILGDHVRIEVGDAGSLDAFLASDAASAIFSSTPTLLKIEKLGNGENAGKLNAADLAALNSSTYSGLAHFTKVDMSQNDNQKQVSFDIADAAGMNMGGMEYLRLPNGMTSAENVAKMANLKGSNNSNLKVVGSFDGSNATLPEIALYSFAENQLSNFSNQMMNLADKAMVVRMAGIYGDKDLKNGDPVFGWTPPCIWDFTGATFTACTLNPGIEVEYYAYDDPFRDRGTSKPGDNYQTNAFFYFQDYAMKVVDIKLPTGLTELPPRSLYRLGQQNVEKEVHKAAFKAYYGVDDDYITNNTSPDFTNCVPIPDLIIPDNYVKLDYECGFGAHIKHLVVGGGTKIVEGAAFSDCLELEDLDFGAGLSNCYLGDKAFKGQANSRMKHIALSEGIVSLGNYCFQNAQHLESIRLPQSLINIGNNAFDNCLALNSITIPENVDKIGMDAFRLCPFTDIYLTTTNPDKIPIIFTGGNSFNNWGAGASFHHGHYDGWEALMGIHPGNAPDGYSWDDAVDWYFINANGLPVLHYPEQLADKVRADISANYHGHSSDTPSLGLPTSLDMHARETAGGADVGTVGQGIYTRDGWAQFMLMKEVSADNPEVYTKKYEDVWYTMCFPFDLTDEQLAAAFNETFNIVDFSGVEIVDEEHSKEGKQTLILHFNTVAKTYYRDSEGNEYEVIGRETDPTSKFDYNIYRRDGVVYHHSQVSSFLSSNKTKTFAPGNSITESNANSANAIIIDGYLATAGHPYMIHPAIGTSKGNPQNCYFSGISWKPMTQWASIFEAQQRTVDLGVAKGTITDDPKTCVPDADNFLQAAYSDYAGQTYTFKGNATQYKDGAQQEIGDEPQVLDKPVKPTKPTAEEVEALKPIGEPLEAPSPVVQDPNSNSKYTDEFKELFSTVRCNVYLGYIDGENRYKDFTYGEDLIQYESTDFLSFHNKTWDGDTEYYEFKTRSDEHNADIQNLSIFKTYLGGNNTVADLTGFNALKQLAIDYVADQQAYATYKEAFDAYIANRAAWAIYNSKKAEMDNWDQDQVDEDFNEAMDAYNASVTAHEQWMARAASYQVLIPTGAYFLGRKGTDFPKFYREIADDTRENPTGGFWTQFTAVIIPNDAAINGIEKELGEGQAASANPSVEMVFDEGFLGEEKTVDEIEQIVAEAEEKGQKVQYMQVVYNINGQIVREGTELTGLPKGVYIVNGKKYFVK